MALTLASPCCGSSCLRPVPSSAGTDHCTGPSGELEHLREGKNKTRCSFGFFFWFFVVKLQKTIE